MLSHPHHNNTNNINNPYNSGSASGVPSSGTFDADRDRTNLNTNTNTNTYTGTGTGTGPYGSTGTTGLGSNTGTGTGTGYGTTGTTGTGTYGSTGTTGLIGSKYPTDPAAQTSYTGTQQPHGHHARTGTQYTESQQPYSGTQQPYTNTTGGTQQPYDGTQQPYSGTQQPYSGTQQPYGSTSGIPGGARHHSVDAVTRDVQAQIDAQAEEAIRKSRELSAQDHARLQASIREATASLEEQARHLKQQIDQERLAAEQHIKQTQQQKLSATAQQQALEEQKILEAAAQRKLELEQRGRKIQQEIDEIIRQKTAQMMAEKPGNLCFTHQHQDTTVGAQLAGNIGHVLDLTNSGRVSEATMLHNPNMQQQQQQQPMGTAGTSGPTYPIQAQVNTVQGQETHEKKGFFHALKTAITGKDSDHDKQHTNTRMGTNTTNQIDTSGTYPTQGNTMGTYPTQNNSTGSYPQTNQSGVGTYPSQVNTTGSYPQSNTMGMKQQQPMMGNRPYDSQSTWASNADKHVPQQTQ